MLFVPAAAFLRTKPFICRPMPSMWGAAAVVYPSAGVPIKDRHYNPIRSLTDTRPTCLGDDGDDKPGKVMTLLTNSRKRQETLGVTGVTRGAGRSY